MNKKLNLPKLPNKIAVDIKKGESGTYLAYLPEYDIFTEADNPTHLFFQVNDLIYTFFEIPKKNQHKVCFIPPLQVRKKLAELDSQKMHKMNFKLTAFSPSSPQKLPQFVSSEVI